jgi:predicted RNase H-like HicB family nuclease
LSATLTYLPDDWEVAPDGGRASAVGVFHATVADAPEFSANGTSVDEALDRLAVVIAASIVDSGTVADRTNETVALNGQVALRQVVRQKLVEAAGEPVVADWYELPEPPCA